mmetsp:Transcript_8251/g.17828  ORF Transcript_8251/g.17828 Transcript_8251/m.17828 type:complete len:207 (+) Transcript_8251:2348-2968(+)
MRWPLSPHSAGIHVPGSLPMLRETFHLVSSNRFEMVFAGLFPRVVDSPLVPEKTIGAGAGNNSSPAGDDDFASSVSLAAGSVFEDDDDDDDDGVNLSLRFSRRRSASLRSSSISFRSSSDSASISATVLFVLPKGSGAMRSAAAAGARRGGDGWRSRVGNAKAAEDAAKGVPLVVADARAKTASAIVESMVANRPGCASRSSQTWM